MYAVQIHSPLLSLRSRKETRHATWLTVGMHASKREAERVIESRHLGWHPMFPRELFRVVKV